jgi:NAD-dependent dihydropyrimidine dehydrogenase PreA subunit
MARRTRISIDYALCGDGTGRDPRACCACLRACDPAVFLMHQTLGAAEGNPLDPQKWRITVMWPTLCTACLRCVQQCPERAITVRS